jgi:hypothetical protein
MSLTGEAVSGLEKALVDVQVGQGDDDGVANAISEAFASAKLDISQHRIRRKIEETAAVALKEIEASV